MRLSQYPGAIQDRRNSVPMQLSQNRNSLISDLKSVHAHAGNAEAFYLPPRQNEKGSFAPYKSYIRDERLIGFINHSFLAPPQICLITQTPSSRPVSEKLRRSKTNPFSSKRSLWPIAMTRMQGDELRLIFFCLPVWNYGWMLYFRSISSFNGNTL